MHPQEAYNNLFSNPNIKNRIENLLSDKMVHARHSTHRAAHVTPVQAFINRLEKLIADARGDSHVVVETRNHRYKIYTHGVKPLVCSIVADTLDIGYANFDTTVSTDSRPQGLAWRLSVGEVLSFFEPLSARVKWIELDNDSLHIDNGARCPFVAVFYPPDYELYVPTSFR